MKGKKKILIVSSYCFDKASANGLCARSLYEDFLSQHDVYLLGIGDKETYTDREYSLGFNKTLLRNEKMSYTFLRRLKATKRFIVPSQDDAMIQGYYKKIQELDEKYKFDIVVAMFFPAEIVSAVSKYKQRTKRSFKYVIYELDSYTDGIVRSTGIKKQLIETAKIRWTKKQYANADRIIVMGCHRNEVSSKYSSFLNKIEFADLPLLCDNTVSRESDGAEGIRFLYTGELNKEYRSPEKLLEILHENIDRTDWHFDFFTKGDCELMVQDYAQSDTRIEMHGYVSRDVITEYYNNADFLISIGNACSNSMPSKIINYISTGKPVIHICLQENDVAAEMLKNYPLSLVISNDMKEKESAIAFDRFVNERFGDSVSYESIYEIFYKSTPEFSRKIIESL